MLFFRLARSGRVHSQIDLAQLGKVGPDHAQDRAHRGLLFPGGVCHQQGDAAADELLGGAHRLGTVGQLFLLRVLRGEDARIVFRCLEGECQRHPAHQQEQCDECRDEYLFHAISPCEWPVSSGQCPAARPKLRGCSLRWPLIQLSCKRKESIIRPINLSTKLVAGFQLGSFPCSRV